ncbi:hypothetical protein GEV33_004323 [Tenebrio molitor]|uniref:Uncharacterized protein n=1 Tax=Tenebrio molitor TaxID=7067 RepID=A0A8J6LDH5_TENMO|nr:hypothetical protein GEV33_004323 [Tenebrio molitor]
MALIPGILGFFYHILHILGIGLPLVQSREAIESPLDDVEHRSSVTEPDPDRKPPSSGFVSIHPCVHAIPRYLSDRQ